MPATSDIVILSRPCTVHPQGIIWHQDKAPEVSMYVCYLKRVVPLDTTFPPFALDRGTKEVMKAKLFFSAQNKGLCHC